MTSLIQIYQSKDSHVQLDVRIEHETIWLTQKQMAELYGTEVPAISKHIKNIYESKELNEMSTISKMEIVQMEGNRTIHRQTTMYNLDIIIAVGYRVNSHKATNFRIWATSILKNYLFNGYAINQRMDKIENQVYSLDQQVQSIIQSSLPPKQGIFFNGQIFDAYQFVSDLIRSAKKTILLIDNYLDDSVLLQLAKREVNVAATVCIRKITATLQLDIDRYNTQYDPIRVLEIPDIHDRFLLIDEEKLYTFGASFKDLGKKIFCFSLIESPKIINAIRKICEDAIDEHS